MKPLYWLFAWLLAAIIGRAVTDEVKARLRQSKSDSSPNRNGESK